MGTRIVSKEFEVDGVLTNVTSAKLSDPTGTYGIKRNDTDAVVVADGTVMTNSATGVYQYPFEDVVDVAYTAYVEFVYGGATWHIECDFPARSSTDGLELPYSPLMVEIADFLGWTRTSGNWTADELNRLKAIIHAGRRQFLYPPPLEGEDISHQWSFLRPKYEFDTVASTYTYDLPATYGAPIGDMFYDEDEDNSYIIEHVSPAMIDHNRAVSDAEGRPYQFAIRPKNVTMTSAQVKELMLYPAPDAAYGIVGYYNARVDDLDDADAYPLGGQEHAETLLQSCLDAAASRYKDDPAGRHHALFLERLKASVNADRRFSPKTLGFNEDGRRITYTRHGTEFSVTMTGNLGTG